ncbi:MAG: hypothetical protein HQL28_00565 [Candidatus Omnitrophica bacterium]|nr:hypothetical protein [Candidatus Omnitrophota bacterium]
MITKTVTLNRPAVPAIPAVNGKSTFSIASTAQIMDTIAVNLSAVDPKIVSEYKIEYSVDVTYNPYRYQGSYIDPGYKPTHSVSTISTSYGENPGRICSDSLLMYYSNSTYAVTVVTLKVRIFDTFLNTYSDWSSPVNATFVATHN